VGKGGEEDLDVVRYQNEVPRNEGLRLYLFRLQYGS
jgi:hypothetical protein